MTAIKQTKYLPRPAFGSFQHFVSVNCNMYFKEMISKRAKNSFKDLRFAELINFTKLLNKEDLKAEMKN